MGIRDMNYLTLNLFTCVKRAKSEHQNKSTKMTFYQSAEIIQEPDPLSGDP